MKNRYLVGLIHQITVPAFDSGEEKQVQDEILRLLKAGHKKKEIKVTDLLLGITSTEVDFAQLRESMGLKGYFDFK